MAAGVLFLLGGVLAQPLAAAAAVTTTTGGGGGDGVRALVLVAATKLEQRRTAGTELRRRSINFVGLTSLFSPATIL